MSSIVGLFTDVLPLGGVQRAGRHVAAVVAKFAGDRGMTVRFLSLNDPQGLHTVRVGQLEFSILGYAGSKIQFLRAALRAASRNPDLVIALHPHLAPIVSAIRLRNRKFRSIVFTHGVDVWQPLAWPRCGALRSADMVIGPSADTVQHLVNEQKISQTKVQRLAWGLDPEFEARVVAAAPATPPAGFPMEARNILTVGRWNSAEKYKGADTLISALPRLLKTAPDASLVLVGDGDDRPRLEQLARDLKVSDHAHFLYGLTPEELFSCYANCEIFALPSRGEGFGLVFLEAMAHAKPVIGGAHGGIPDIIEDGVTGRLVRHGDVEQLAQVLEALLSNPGEAKEMGVRGKDRVAQLFSFAQFESQLAGILNLVLSQEH
ncbi:MAG TPA: glycosyltransferase family 4 protein [Candidatus Saccharimonadales bacterium]|jgi:phosphatidylinositol alpha-1,6-mannosyltransferase|nr:glycosyltransferase family 4 protein [Candidatus Saccharimonadales bacterium]